MDGFFIDTLGNGDAGQQDEGERDKSENGSGGDAEWASAGVMELFDEPLPGLKLKERNLKKENTYSLENTYLISSYKNLKEESKGYSNVDKLLEKSVIRPGLEKQIRAPPEKGKKLLRLERQKLRKRTKGKEWFDMPAAERTKEVMNDFKLLKMRSALDKRHVYKKNDITDVPKYFQVGKVIESPADFYNGRIPKTQRKKTFVDELLADAEFQRYQKKKFKEIMDENRRKKPWKKSKVNSKKGKSAGTVKGNSHSSKY